MAHLCWQYVNLGPGIGDPAAAGARVALIADAYDLDDRSILIETVLWWRDRCWRGIESAANAGDAAMWRLRELGAVSEVRDAFRWTLAHRSVLEHIVR